MFVAQFKNIVTQLSYSCKQYERLANAVDRGIAEKADEMRWLFPTLTAEEIEEKLARIDANKSVNEDEALERMLMGG